MFTLQSFGLASTAFNQPSTVDVSGEAIGSPRIFSYQSNVDTIEEMSNDDYFLDIQDQLTVGDLIYIKGTNGTNLLTFTTVSFSSVITGIAVSTSATLQYVSVPISSAQFLNLNNQNIELVPAQGPNTLIVLNRYAIMFEYGGIAYQDGGLVEIEYETDPPNPNAGNAASSPISENSFKVTYNAFIDDTVLEGVSETAECTNRALMFAKQGSAFTVGNSNMRVHVWYSVISTIV